jgi:hypothetical protein
MVELFSLLSCILHGSAPSSSCCSLGVVLSVVSCSSEYVIFFQIYEY